MRCRKRRFIPMRPAELGHGQVDELDRRLQDDAGQQRSGVDTAPRTETPEPTSASLGEDQRDPIQPGSAWRSSSAIVSNPISASWLIST